MIFFLITLVFGSVSAQICRFIGSPGTIRTIGDCYSANTVSDCLKLYQYEVDYYGNVIVDPRTCYWSSITGCRPSATFCYPFCGGADGFPRNAIGNCSGWNVAHKCGQYYSCWTGPDGVRNCQGCKWTGSNCIYNSGDYCD